MEWLLNNKEWLFSGIGIAVFIAVWKGIAFLRKRIKKDEPDFISQVLANDLFKNIEPQKQSVSEQKLQDTHFFENNIFSIIETAKKNTLHYFFDKGVLNEKYYLIDDWNDINEILIFPQNSETTTNRFICIIENYFLKLPNEKRQELLNRAVEKILTNETLWFFEVLEDIETFSTAEILLKIIKDTEQTLGQLNDNFSKQDFEKTNYFHATVNGKLGFFIGVLHIIEVLEQIADTYNLNFTEIFSKYPLLSKLATNKPS